MIFKRFLLNYIEIDENGSGMPAPRFLVIIPYRFGIPGGR
jgi:hypothetical protein